MRIAVAAAVLAVIAGSTREPMPADKEPADVGCGGTFEVPSLRVVPLTARHYHVGRCATLDKAVRAMASYAQRAAVAAAPAADEVVDLVAFLAIP